MLLSNYDMWLKTLVETRTPSPGRRSVSPGRSSPSAGYKYSREARFFFVNSCRIRGWGQSSLRAVWWLCRSDFELLAPSNQPPRTQHISAAMNRAGKAKTCPTSSLTRRSLTACLKPARAMAGQPVDSSGKHQAIIKLDRLLP